jgi:large subunit ribosomal protein L18
MEDKLRLRLKRHRRIRYKIAGTADRPRLAVYRSSKNIYAQLIDDDARHTLASASTVDASIRGEGKSGANTSAAKAVGTLIAARAKELGVTNVVFDRGGYIYHGRVQQLADAAREGGLQF